MNAADALLVEVRAWAMSYARRGGLSTADAEDIAQDVLVLFWTNDLALISDDMPARALAWTRVKWTTIDAMRRARMCRRNDLRAHLPREIPSETARTEARSALRVALPILDAMEPREREAMLADDEWGGLSAFAKSIGVHPSSVTRWREKGLRMLQRAGIEAPA